MLRILKLKQMDLINPLDLSKEEQKELTAKCKASARMRKGIAATETIDFKLKERTVYGRLVQNCKAFAIESINNNKKEKND